MHLGRALTIARANLVRLMRDRLGLFFIVLLPLIIILVTGLQFGGGFEARVGLLARDGGELADELAAALDRDWEVKRFTDADALIGDVEDGAVAYVEDVYGRDPALVAGLEGLAPEAMTVSVAERRGAVPCGAGED